MPSSSIVKIVFSAGTNNLFRNSANEIVQEIQDIHKTLLEKFPNASIWIQSILPRLFVPRNIVDKIKDTNKKLFNVFGRYFLNIHKEFTADNDMIKKDLFQITSFPKRE